MWMRLTTAMLALAWCRPLSVRAGESVELHAAANGARVEVEVVRDGPEPVVAWRGTAVARPSTELDDAVVADGCDWPECVSIPTGVDWPSGFYLVRLVRGGKAAPPTAWFVVRAREPNASGCLLVLATNTWNAYNDTGGLNLYTGATAVSFERPLAIGMLAKPDGTGTRPADGARPYLEYTAAHALGMWHGMAGWAGQERRFAHWAERAGLALDFAINADLEDATVVSPYRLSLSVGHDEYWSAPMRDTVEAFVAAGGNAAFLSGNTCYWQVRVDGARMTCFKHRFAEDPLLGRDDARVTTMWSDPLVRRPENALTGVTFTRGGYHRIHRSAPHGAGGYEVHRPDHWLFEGTRLQRGDLFGAPNAVGYECDGCDLALVGGLPVPTGADGTPIDFEVLATAPATPFDARTTPLPLAPGGDYELEFHARRLLGDASPESCDRLRNGHAVLGTYTRNGTVVTTGCTDWAFALEDPQVDRVTRNLIGRLGVGR
jgi:N,N-dimethylformamidase beta subunit-like, C-terminal